MIQNQQIDAYLRAAASSRLKGRMGLQPTVCAGAVIPPINMNTASLYLAMTAKSIESMGQKNCKLILNCLDCQQMDRCNSYGNN
jgi:hypothetical protein